MILLENKYIYTFKGGILMNAIPTKNAIDSEEISLMYRVSMINELRFIHRLYISITNKVHYRDY
jgi:hypothetical protein